MTDGEFLHSGDAKKNQVQAMFDGVARRYDFLNHFLSLGIDLYWRRQAVQALRLENGQHLLDVATGTGDQGFSALKAADIQVTGLDFSFNMLKLAQKKSGTGNWKNAFGSFREMLRTCLFPITVLKP